MEQRTLKQKVKQFCQSEYIPFVVFGIAIFLIICRIGLKDNSDDTYYKAVLSQTTLFSWLQQRYLVWSGRISVDLAIGLMNFNIPLWRIFNSFMAALLMLCISNFATANIQDEQKRKIINIILCCSFFSFYPYVVTSSVMWYTGSFNYLWTTTACLCALLPFYYALIGRKTIYKISYILYFIATAFACYMEQTLAIIACFGALTFIFLIVKKKEIPLVLIGQYFFALINIIIYASAPGTRVRAIDEIMWYRDYSMLTPVDKIFQAVNWTNRHYITASNLLFILVAALIFAVCYVRFKNNKIVFFASAIPFLYSLLRVIPFNIFFSRIANFQHNIQNPYESGAAINITIDIESALDKYFYNCTTANPSNLNNGFESLLPSIVSLTIILFIAVLLFFAFHNREIRFVSVILYFAALASSYIMAFSPTIFASGSRVFFIGDVLMLLIAGLLLKELLTISEIMQKRYAKYFLYGMIAFAGIMFIDYVANFVNQIFWL